jgi:hypothetical protein
MNAVLKNKSVQKTITILLIFLVLYLSYKFAGKILHDLKLKRQAKQRENAINDYVDGSGNVSENDLDHVISKKNEWFLSKSDTLFNAMNGYGADIDTIESVLSQLKTKAEFYKLAKAFGVRKSSWNPFWEGDLLKWIQSEVHWPFKDRINKQLKRLGVEI